MLVRERRYEVKLLSVRQSANAYTYTHVISLSLIQTHRDRHTYILTFMWVDRKVYMMTSYLLLMTFFDQWDSSSVTMMEKVYGPQKMLKNKTYLVTFSFSLSLSLTHSLSLFISLSLSLYIYIYIYKRYIFVRFFYFKDMSSKTVDIFNNCFFCSSLTRFVQFTEKL